MALHLHPRMLLLAVGLMSITGRAAEVAVTDPSGQALAAVMVTQTLARPNPPDISDHGYQQPGKAHRTDTELTAFTDASGKARLPDRAGAVFYRLRKPGYQDQVMNAAAGQSSIRATMPLETDPLKLPKPGPPAAGSAHWMSAVSMRSGISRCNAVSAISRATP